MKKALPAVVVLTGVMVGACGEEEEPQEVVDKLRGLGAVASPLVLTPTETSANPSVGRVKIFAALRSDKKAKVAPWQDEPVSGALLLDPSQIQVDESSKKYEQHPKLQVFSVEASVQAPPEAALTRGDSRIGQVRYGFKITSGPDTEYLVGNFLVLPAERKAHDWKNPGITIEKPPGGNGVSGETTNLTASTKNPNGEELKIGWFVTGGEIVNRRAAETTWKLPGSGKHTVIATVRGKDSRGFAMDVVTVTVD